MVTDVFQMMLAARQVNGKKHPSITKSADDATRAQTIAGQRGLISEGLVKQVELLDGRCLDLQSHEFRADR